MAMYTYLQQALTRVVIHRTRVVVVFRSKLEQKIPVTECYSDVFLFCFLMRNLWVAVFVSVAITFHSFALCAAKVPSVSALEFRCCRAVLEAGTKDEANDH